SSDLDGFLRKRFPIVSRQYPIISCKKKLVFQLLRRLDAHLYKSRHLFLRERAAPLDESERNRFSCLHKLIFRSRITGARKTICRMANIKNVSVRPSPNAKASIILHADMISA